MNRCALGWVSLFLGVCASANEGTQIRPAPGEAAILIRLSASAECAEKPSVAWLSKGRTLLYQADVSPNGTLELHTRPGEYNLVVTGMSGCFVEKIVSVQANEAKDVALKLDRPTRAPVGGAKE